MKRFLSLFLSLCLVFSMVPAQAFAAEADPQAQVNNDDVSMEGTSPLGNMLVAEIQEEQDASEESSGFSVLSLLVEGNNAYVTFTTMEKANLVVALYTEDGVQMLTSGKVAVHAGQTEATVAIEGTVPQYFFARAFLVDTYDFSPLCKSYATPMYTREMQELLASTAEDYDPDRVLALDADTSSNFLVYQEETLVIRPADGVNTMTQANDETRTYVFENADSTVTAMEPGDVFAYEAGASDVVIVKVGSIFVDGTTVTVTGQDVELEEAFSHVKLEQSGHAGQMQADPGTAPDEGITFEGVDNGSNMRTRGVGADISLSGTIKFSLQKKLVDKEGTELTLEGNIKLKNDVHLAFYVSFTHRFIEFKIDTELTSELAISGKLQTELALGDYTIFLAGIQVGLKPKIVLSVSAELAFQVTIASTLGFSYVKGDGWQNLCEPVEVKDKKLSIEGELFIGLDLCPQVEVIDEHIAEVSVKVPIGVELKGELYQNPNYTDIEEYDGTVHKCQKCVEMELYFKAEIGIEITFLNCDFFKLEGKAQIAKIKILDMYHCLDTGTAGMGVCPNIDYRVTVAVENADHEPVQGVEVVYDIVYDQFDDQFVAIDLGQTNENGIARIYLPAAEYTFRAYLNGKSYDYTHDLSGAGKVILGPNVLPGRNFIAEQLNPKDFLQYGKELLTGTCGDDLQFVLYKGGDLYITGTGPMTDFPNSYNAPWEGYAHRIKRVIVDKDVESIGNRAFYFDPNDLYGSYSNLTEVILGEDLERIGQYAFYKCSNLKTINFPSQLTTIEKCAFDGCQSLEAVTIPKKVTLIGGYAFRDTRALKKLNYEAVNANAGANYTNNFTRAGMNSGGFDVIIDKGVERIPSYLFAYESDGSQTGQNFLKSVVFEPGSKCTEIGNYAFDECTSVAEIVLPEGLEVIGDYAFQFSTIRIPGIPSTVTTIGKSAFYKATALQELILPPNLTSIGTYAFDGCTALTKVSFNSSVATIPSSAFAGCTALEEVRLFDGLLTIDQKAFYGCTALKEIAIPNTVTAINKEAFSGCSSLATATLGKKLITVGAGAFQNCSSLKSVVIPDSVTTIGSQAFYGNTAMESFHLGSSVKELDADVLHYNHNLATLTVSADSSYFVGKGNCIITKSGWSSKELVVGCKNSVIPTDGSVTKIGQDAFRYNEGLTSITIPSKVSYIYYNAFSDCPNLSTVIFSGSKVNLSNNAFSNCTSLETIQLPTKQTDIPSSAFSGCTALTAVVIPDSVTTIGSGSFSGCTALETVTIGSGVTTLNRTAFSGCSKLSTVIFTGNAPTTFNSSAFQSVTATVYYPEGNTTWDSVINQNYGGTLTWEAYTPGTDPVVVTTEDSTQEPAEESQNTGSSTGGSISAPADTKEQPLPASRAIYPGSQNSSEAGNNVTLHTATFEDLVPGQEYLFLAVVNMEAEDLLAADNLLYIYQAPADENGMLTVQYVQRVETDPFYIMACGASQKNLSEAQIQFPAMYADATLQTVRPTVTYGGDVLTEGNDYILSGAVDFSLAGEYTCYIRGIYDYSGLLKCTYTVGDIADAQVTFQEKVYHNLRLQDLTKIGYAFTIEEQISATFGVLIWTDGEMQNVTVDTEGVQNKLLTYDKGFYTAESDGIYAQQLDTIHYARPYAKIGSTYFYGAVDTYSPLMYIREVLDDDDEALKQLMIDLLNYGAYAQLYFAEGQKVAAPEVLINDILAEEQKLLNWSDDLKVATPAVTRNTAKALDAQWYGTNLNLLEAIQMNMAATGQITGMYYWTEEDYHNVSVLDATTASAETVIRTDGSYTIGGISGIVAAGIHDVYYVCCYDADGNLGPIRADSVASYATRLMDSTKATQATVNLAKALLIYGNSAAAYFANHS